MGPVACLIHVDVVRGRAVRRVGPRSDSFCFSSRGRHTRLQGDWSSDVCSSDLDAAKLDGEELTAYLEGERVKLAQYEQWRIALDEGGGASASTNKRIRQLERELARKEKDRKSVV